MLGPCTPKNCILYIAEKDGILARKICILYINLQSEYFGILDLPIYCKMKSVFCILDGYFSV